MGIKKVFLFIGIMFFLTGCEGEYHLEIKGDDFAENFAAISYDNTTWDLENEYGWSLKKDFELEAKFPTPAFYGSDVNSEEGSKLPNVEYYEKELIEYEDTLQINYKYNFNKSNFPDAMSVLAVFPAFSINDVNNIVTLDSGRTFAGFYNYSEMDKLKIVITTDRKVVDHNADQVINGKYTWIIDEDMLDEKNLLGESIQFSYENIAAPKNNSLVVVLIVLISIAILVTVVIIFARYRISVVNR